MIARKILLLLNLLAVVHAPVARADGAAGAEPAGKGSQADSYQVILFDQAPFFEPKRLRIPVGSTVTWENRGPSLIHTIFMRTASGDVRSSSIKPGQSWSHTFTAEENAVVKAVCEVHPYMYGMVIVGDPPDSLLKGTEAAVASSSKSLNDLRALRFELPVADSVPGVLAMDAQDNVWIAMGGGGWANIDHPPLNLLGRLSLEGDLQTFALPTAGSVPSGLVVTPEGIVYATEFLGNRIARLDPSRKSVEEIVIPTPDSRPTGIGLDPEGNVWFGENAGNKIGRLSPAGVITEFPVPTPNAKLTGLVVDPEGNVWFSERDANKVGCLRRDLRFVEYALPTPNAGPTGLAVDRRGGIWVAQRRANRLARIAEGKVVEYALPNPDSGPFFIVPDDDGKVWFTQLFGDRIGRLDPDTGEVAEYNLAEKGGWPGGLAMDSQGNLWYSLHLKNTVGVLVRSPDVPASTHVMPREAAGRPGGGTP